MVDNIQIRNSGGVPFLEFLEKNDFAVENITDNVIQITRLGELPVFIHSQNTRLFFEVDLGNIADIATADLYFKLLDLNTKILPVSLGFDTTNDDDPRLVLVESRETDNLDDNEVLSVLNALEIATDKVENILSEYLK